MTLRLLLNTPTLLLFHDTSCDCLCATWYESPSAEITLVNYQHILRQVQETHSTKLLNDCLINENGWQEAAAWLTKSCFPALAVAGLRSIAWVLPRQEQALCNTQALLRQVNGILVDTFSAAESAYTWLRRW